MILKDSVVLITGASKGIGKACVEAFAEQGANVIINYAHDEKGAQEAAGLAAKHGVETLVVQANVTKQADVDAMLAKIKVRFPAIDVLVNSAGVFDESDNPENLDAFRNVFENNFLGQVRVTNGARTLMIKGKILFVSSVSGAFGQGAPDSIAYAAMKAALDSYVRNLARALAPDILVNAIAPGATLTPMWGEMDKAYKTGIASGMLINRWLEPSEVADGIVFLAKSDAACGSVLVLDGGDSLKTG